MLRGRKLYMDTNGHENKLGIDLEEKEESEAGINSKVVKI